MMTSKRKKSVMIIALIISMILLAGFFTVQSVEAATLYGDADGDSVVKGLDVLLLRQYMANYDDDTQTSSVTVGPGADADGNGVINGLDVILLRQYMANYDDETGESTVKLGPSLPEKAPPTSISNVTNTGDLSIKVTWNFVDGVNGYELQVSQSENFLDILKTIKETTKNNAVISSLSDGTTYYCRIRTYQSIGQETIYSDWSSVKNIKVNLTIPTIRYQAHVREKGWMSLVADGKTAGTTGEALRAEAIKIELSKEGNSMIQYRTHLADIGWTDWVNSGQVSGTTGEERQIEALEIKLTGEYANLYDVYYRAHIAYYGWLDWTKSGAAGSIGCAVQLEAFEVKLVKKGQMVGNGGVASFEKPELKYKSHIQELDWQDYVSNGEVSGTTGQSKQIEAIKMRCVDFNGTNAIKYQTHSKDNGWTGWKIGGEVSGTTGENRRIEAIQVQLTGWMASVFDVCYRVHVAELGWLGWAQNGEIAGTTGCALRVEALQVVLVYKGNGSLWTSGGVSSYDKDTIPAGVLPGQQYEETGGFDPIWPCENTYTITCLYRYSSGSLHSTRFQYGIDIGAYAGENVFAVESGTVITSEYSNSSGFGNWIMIQHDNGKVSLYAHLQQRLVDVGTYVSKGQVIGFVGNTSAKYSIGAHLHFELAEGNYSGAAGDPYQEYYKNKYSLDLVQAAAIYNTP